MRKAFLVLVASFFLAACNPHLNKVVPPPKPAPPVEEEIDPCEGGVPASATPGPGLTDPSSPMYDPNWEQNYPEVWC